MLEITFLGAAFAGLLSFLSPCILPIVPFYLSYLAGVGMNQITADGPVDAASAAPRGYRIGDQIGIIGFLRHHAVRQPRIDA